MRTRNPENKGFCLYIRIPALHLLICSIAINGHPANRALVVARLEPAVNLVFVENVKTRQPADLVPVLELLQANAARILLNLLFLLTVARLLFPDIRTRAIRIPFALTVISTINIALRVGI